MNESKELLEATIKGLEDKVNSLNTDITMKKKELEDINKPEMQGEMFDKIHVEDGVSEFDFSDAGNYEFEPELDYDNRVAIGSIELNNHYEVVSLIMNKIDHEFKVIVKEKE
jgi:hypothetical protein